VTLFDPGDHDDDGSDDEERRGHQHEGDDAD
jgi:hypothetical protein